MVNKLNCTTGNYQCGGKCQPNTNECPKELSSDTEKIIGKYTTMIKTKSKKSTSIYPKEFEESFKNLDPDVEFDAKIGIRDYIKEMRNEDEEFNNNFKNKHKDLKDGVIYYALDGYHDINPTLRKSDPKDMEESDIAMLKVVLDDFDKLPPLEKDTVVYRGEKDYEGRPKYSIGEEFQVKGLYSTTTDPKIADMFGDNIQYNIKAKAGGQAKPLNFGEESEVLINHNTNMKVMDIKIVNGKTIYYLEEQ